MMWIPLALLTLTGWAADPDPTALVARLSSPVPAEREEAAGVLEELGRPALPVLYKARETASGDLGRRVALLIDLIERQRLLRATRVVLDFDARPLSEVVAALGARSGFPLVLEAAGARRDRKLTLRAAQPVPFWEALDRLAAAGGVRLNPGVPSSPAHRSRTLPLVVDDGPAMPSDHAGPFRVNVVRVGRHREVVPARPPAKPRVRDRFSAVLQVCAEPGLAINPNGPLVLEVATDDRGHDLRAESHLGPHPQPPWPLQFDEAYLGLLQYDVPLRLPVAPGQRITRLKGYIPVTVLARPGGPVEVPLSGPAGKWYSGNGVALAVTRIERDGETTRIELAFRIDRPEPSITPGSPPAPLGEFRPPYRLDDHLRVLDDQGRTCWCSSGQQGGSPYGIQRASLTFTGQGGVGPPVRLLYHEVVGVATEVVFEFSDLPLP